MAAKSEPGFAPPITGFKGINNRIDPIALGLQWQLGADNALVDNAGFLIRRPGYSAVLSNVVDLYGTKDGRLFVVTADTSLFEVAADGSYRQRAIGFSGAPFQWAELGYAIFAMSETTAWVIYPKRVAAWGIPTLSAPTVATTSGNFPTGAYNVACILAAADGRLGGCSGVSSITLTAGQGLVITSPAVAGYTTRAYLSQTDGALLYAVSTPLDNGMLTLTTLPTLGARLQTQAIYPPPQGQVIGSYNSRMVVGVWEPEFDRSVLYYSQADAPHWFAVDTDYQLLPGKIGLLVGVANTLLIGTDRALWVQTQGAPLQQLANYGVIPGTQTWIDSGQVVFWTDNGMVTYPPFANLTDAAFYPDNRTLASGAILYHEGSAYYITAQRGEIRPIPQRPPFVPLAVTTHSV